MQRALAASAVKGDANAGLGSGAVLQGAGRVKVSASGGWDRGGDRTAERRHGAVRKHALQTGWCHLRPVNGLRLVACHLLAGPVRGDIVDDGGIIPAGLGRDATALVRVPGPGACNRTTQHDPSTISVRDGCRTSFGGLVRACGASGFRQRAEGRGQRWPCSSNFTSWGGGAGGSGQRGDERGGDNTPPTEPVSHHGSCASCDLRSEW